MNCQWLYKILIPIILGFICQFVVANEKVKSHDSISSIQIKELRLLPTSHLAFPDKPALLMATNPGGVGTGLKLWLKADDMGSYTRSAGGVWTDRSGNSNNAVNSASNNSSQVAADAILHPKLNTSTSLFNFNPTVSFNKSQMQINLGIKSTEIGSMETFVVVNGQNAIFGNGNSNEVERHMATHRFKSGNGSSNYTNFQGGESNINKLRILHLNHNGTSSTAATGYMSVNGGTIGSFSERNLDGGMAGKFHLGNAGAYGNFQGEIAEFIIYDSAQSTANRNKIFSYLGIKYGIPIESSGFDYINGGGTTIFEAAENSGYTNNVFGIGNDSNSGLNQKISENSTSQLIVSLQNDFTSANTASSRNSNNHNNANQYFIISDNGGSNGFTNTNVDGTNYVKRFNRIWKVNKTNFDENIVLKFNSLTNSSEADLSYLLVDADGDFSSGAINRGLIGSDKVIATTVIPDGHYFTVARSGTVPGLANFEDMTKIYTNGNFDYDRPSSNSSGAITYSSSNTSVATISSSGRVTITGVGNTTITASQAANGNYYAGSITAILTVNKANLTITADDKSKTYDGSVFSAGYSVSGSGFRSGESLSNLSGSVSYSGTAMSATEVGSYIITPNGYSSNNYNFIYENGSLTISRINLTISGVTGNNKIYDGTTAATVNSSSVTYSGLRSGDNIGYAVTGVFANKNVGNGKVINLTETATGPQAGRYNITFQGTTTGNITPKSVTVTGVTALDKNYDGNTSAVMVSSAIEYTGVISGDDLVAIPTGNFSDVSVGNDKVVNITYTNGGSDANNYSISGQTTTRASIKYVDNVLDFDGSDYVKAPGATLPSGAGSYTIEAWIKPTDNLNRTIASWGEEASYQSVGIKVYRVSGNSWIRVYWWAEEFNIAAPEIKAGEWNHVATTWDGSVRKIFVNGRLLGSNTPSNTLNVTQTNNLNVGARQNLEEKFNGQMDEVRIWNDARTLSEIQGNLNNELIGSEANLVAYFNFNQGTAGGDNTSITAATSQSGTITGTLDTFTLNGSRSNFVDGDRDPLYFDNSISIDTYTKTYGDPVFSATASTTTPSTGNITYSSSNSSVATINSSTGSVTITGVGTTTIGAIQAQSGLYNEASDYKILTVQAKTLTATLIGNITKEYDGNTNATLTSSHYQFGGFVGSEGASVSKTSGSYNNSSVGTSKLVSVSLTSADMTANSGTSLNNYIFPATVTGTIGEITKKRIIISGVAVSNKVYDGTTDASVVLGSLSTSGIIGSDNIGYTATAIFDDKNVGTNINVTLTESISGGQSGNYTITYQGVTQADINPKSISVSYTTSISKTYDGNANAIINTSNYSFTGFVSGESATNSQTIGTYDTKEVGNGKTVSIQLTDDYKPGSGTFLSNYTLPSTLSYTLGEITKKNLTISGITAADKVYDGTTAATIDISGITYAGLASGDALSYTVTGTFDTKNVGTGKTVTFTQSSTAAVASNYSITYQLTTTANITAKTVTGTLAGSISKEYDSTDTATLNTGNYTLYGFISGESATVNETAGAYDNENVGTGKTVSVVSLTNSDYTPASGTLLSNYTLPSTLSYTLGEITKKNLTISGITAVDKVYDGTTAATIDISGITYTGLVSGDALSYTVTGTFDTKNVGTGKTVTFTQSSTAAVASNYSITYQLTTTANITAKTVTVTHSGTISKVYDGNTNATIDTNDYTITGFIAGESATVTQTAASYANKNVGTGKTVTIDLTNAYNPASGTLMSNYAPTQTITVTNGVITGNSVTLIGNSGIDKLYDDNNQLPLAGVAYGSLTGIASGDNVVITGAPQYDSKNAGARNIVQGTLDITGTDAANYSFNWINGSGTIFTRTLTITAKDDAKFVTQTDTPGYQGVSIEGFISDDNITDDLSGSLVISRTNSPTETANVYSNVLSPTGYTATNYTIKYVAGQYTITPADQLLVTLNNINQIYGGTYSFTISSGKYLSSTSSTVITLNAPTIVGNQVTYSDGASGQAVFKVSASGASYSTSNHLKVGNYPYEAIDIIETSNNFSNIITLNGSIEITAKTITATMGTASKVYDTTAATTGLSASLTGTLENDIISINGIGSYGQSQAGTGIRYEINSLELSGVDANNYILAGSGTLSKTDGIIRKAPLNVVASNDRKISDGVAYSGGNGVTISGFVGSENSSVLTGTLTYIGTSQGATNPGTYSIEPSGYFADNYQINYTAASLIIEEGNLDIDGDGVLDINDNCVNTPNSDQLDTDLDGIGDVCDLDIDGDGCLNEVDAFPLDPNECEDTDKDGTGNNKDEDDDGDGQLDDYENRCGSDSMDYNSMALDTDGDKIPDCVDEDDDNDGFIDTLEQRCGSDSLDKNSTPLDTDSDGILNCDDLDDDGDGQSDTDEIACGTNPLDANSFTADTDGDGITDCFDLDIDGDGCLNEQDAFPFDPAECVDTDADGIGNNSDLDDDGDGQTDADELSCGSDPLNALSLSEDLNEDGIPDCVKPFDIEISQLLTPKEFGQESVWELKYITAFPNSEVKVYNRHKQLVFGTKRYQNDWSGTHKNTGAYLPAGPYYYVIQVNDGRQPTYTGWLYITY